MKVLSTFLLLSSALAQRDSAGRAPDAVDSLAAVADAALVSAEAAPLAASAAPESATAAPADGEKHGPVSYVPLFDFDLAPYNMALEIVADALEKLADTMEPLDVPLPLVGPGYYLEVQVKSTKGPNGRPQAGELNPVSIEGGQALPVTEIDIILPGDTAVHQTILISAQSQGTQAMEPPHSDLAASQSEPALATSKSAVDSAATLLSAAPTAVLGGLVPEDSNPASQGATSAGGSLTPSMLAGTRSASAPLIDTIPETPAAESRLTQTALTTPPMGMENMGTSASSSEGEGTSIDEVLSGGTNMASSSAWGFSSSAGGLAVRPGTSAVPSSASGPISAASTSSTSAEQSLGLGIGSGSTESGSSIVASASSIAVADGAGRSSPDPWFGLFPPFSSSAPGTAGDVSSSSDTELLYLEPESAVSESKEQSGPRESLDSGPADEATTVSELLPFPPFGGPRTQQPSDASRAYPASLGASSTSSGNAGGVETIDILDAPDENALESSIDAVIHSVIQDYRSESRPKAAVGFALIHPRSMAAPEWS
ncbi:hypothetical protein LPJ61_000520 [Coemansia biformis]|uniref:Uncharacterized protein n=1 Tax=Coemansia biformis TaxID=1286918 RepID=A0A9W8CY36_9FUNG|nr:hypothetical protein LPJ61_000520 [Coemansia biformis]